MIPYDGTGGEKRLKLPEGAGQAQWSADGRTLLYLRANFLEESDPDAGTFKLVARTSQYVQFSRNGDGTVFVGISGSIAQPHVLLMLRSTRRELTLCEHKTSRPADAAPNRAPAVPRSQRPGTTRQRLPVGAAHAFFAAGPDRVRHPCPPGPWTWP